MRQSFVLHLIPERLAEGEFIGEIEDVATQQRAAVHNVDDLVAFCTRTLRTATLPARALEMDLPANRR